MTLLRLLFLSLVTTILFGCSTTSWRSPQSVRPTPPMDYIFGMSVKESIQAEPLPLSANDVKKVDPKYKKLLIGTRPVVITEHCRLLTHKSGKVVLKKDVYFDPITVDNKFSQLPNGYASELNIAFITADHQKFHLSCNFPAQQAKFNPYTRASEELKGTFSFMDHDTWLKNQSKFNKEYIEYQNELVDQ